MNRPYQCASVDDINAALLNARHMLVVEIKDNTAAYLKRMAYWTGQVEDLAMELARRDEPVPPRK